MAARSVRDAPSRGRRTRRRRRRLLATSSDERRQHQHPGQLDEHGGVQRGVATARRRGDDLADVVDAGADPRPEQRRVAEPERAAQQRQHDDGQRAAQRHEGDRDGDVLLVGVGDVVHGGDRRRPADRVAGRDEQAEVLAEAEPAAEPAGRRERRRPPWPMTMHSSVQPSDSTSPTDSWKPRRATPPRSSVRPEKAMPGAAAAGQQAGVGDERAEGDGDDERRQRVEPAGGDEGDGDGARRRSPGRAGGARQRRRPAASA